MTQLISIGAQEHLEYLRAKLGTEIKLLQEEGIKVELEENKAGEITFLGCNIYDYGTSDFTEENAYTIFRHYAANVVSDIIVNNWEEDLIRKIIEDNYTYFSKQEQEGIFNGATRQLNNGDENEDNFILYKISRKSKILQNLLDYLCSSDNLIIEGFIRFRLKDYLEDLNDAVNHAVDDYLLEKEYREFIRLLKYFVDIQEPRMEEVNVVLLANGSFRLLDGLGQAMNNELLDGFMVDFTENELNYEDILISSLISIAPKAITIHSQGKIKMVNIEDTVNHVFGEKVKYCKGCSTCRQIQNIEH